LDDPPIGDCVGLFPAISVGLREGDERGAIDRTSTRACPTGGDSSVGAFVSSLLGDVTGVVVEPLVDPTAGDCVVTSVGLRDGDETGAIDRTSTGASVSGKSVSIKTEGRSVLLMLGEGPGVSVVEGLREFELPPRLGFVGGTVVILLGATVGIPAKSTLKSVVGATVGAEFGLIERPSNAGFACGAVEGSFKSGGSLHTQLH
jgi:hypothetical protein